MGKKDKWSWSSAIVGAATAVAASTLIRAKPKNPTFHLVSMQLTSLNLNPPALDADVILTVHVTNPNITAIHFSSTVMSISYEGAPLGSAPVRSGSQPARSCQLLRLPAKIHVAEFAHHARRFVADVGKREMALESKVDIEGAAKVLWWDHRFRVHVDSLVTVDPVFLDVIDQESKSKLDLFHV